MFESEETEIFLFFNSTIRFVRHAFLSQKRGGKIDFDQKSKYVNIEIELSEIEINLDPAGEAMGKAGRKPVTPRLRAPLNPKRRMTAAKVEERRQERAEEAKRKAEEHKKKAKSGNREWNRQQEEETAETAAEQEEEEEAQQGRQQQQEVVPDGRKFENATR